MVNSKTVELSTRRHSHSYSVSFKNGGGWVEISFNGNGGKISTTTVAVTKEDFLEMIKSLFTDEE